MAASYQVRIVAKLRPSFSTSHASSPAHSSSMDLFRTAQPSLLESAWQWVQTPYTLIRGPVNAILSIPTAIPALSFVIFPFFTSYTTSLNLALFYITWSTLLLSHDKLKVEFFGTLIIRVVFYILPSLGFFLFDSAVPSLAVNTKEHGDVALPLSAEQGGKTGRWWKVALVSVGNVFLAVLLQCGIEFLFTDILHIRSALKISNALPMPWNIAKDLLRGLLVREVCFFLPLPYIHNGYRAY